MINDVVLRGKRVAGAVYVGGEGAAFVLQFADRSQGEDLEAAAVRQDGAVPAFEPVESAGLVKHVEARTEIEVIGVPEDDLGTYILFQIPVIDAFDGPYSPDGHEDGGMDLPVVGLDKTGPCRRCTVAR